MLSRYHPDCPMRGHFADGQHRRAWITGGDPGPVYSHLVISAGSSGGIFGTGAGTRLTPSRIRWNPSPCLLVSIIAVGKIMP